ncbi:MAG: ParB N-terminal domain-containing protein [Candidatus Izemoplasmatales bacterium]
MGTTLKSAMQAAKANRIEQWIHKMLLEGDNPNEALSKGLKIEKRFFVGPVKIKLSDFNRVSGPEENMLYRIKEIDFNHRVKKMMNEIELGWDVPPLLIECQDNGFYMCDGNHRYEALKRSGKDIYYAIFWYTTPRQKTILDSYI